LFQVAKHVNDYSKEKGRKRLKRALKLNVNCFGEVAQGHLYAGSKVFWNAARNQHISKRVF
jgi:hypothetical protein